MIQGIFAAARIQGVAVRQKRLAAEFFDEICHRLDILRAQGRQVAQFPEMHLDRREFAFEIDVLHAGEAAEFLQLLRQARPYGHAEIGHIHFCFFHAVPSLSWRNENAPSPEVRFCTMWSLILYHIRAAK